MINRYKYPDEVWEHLVDVTDVPSRPATIWTRSPRICGNCPLAYESTKCKRTSCRVKSLERRGIPAVY